MGRTKSIPMYVKDIVSYGSDSAQYSPVESREKARTVQDQHYDFLSTLAAAQFFGIDVTPLTWLPHLKGLGEGGTATISQAIINAQLSLAFKRCDTESHSRARVYEILLREICILSQEPVRSHPNIIRLQGICFETPEKDAVFPVLVFNKAEHSDLHNFMSKKLGQDMDIAGKIDILRQIIGAVATLHRIKVIHGDIKPQNILMFIENGKLVPRISDFGYASIADPSVEKCIQLPLSKPWTAPEHRFVPFSFENARRMDIYSLGRLCLWFLQCSGKQVEALPEEGATATEEQQSVESWSRMLEDMSTQSSLDKIVSRMTQDLPETEVHVASGLGAHIAQMISHADTRPETLESLVTLLSPDQSSMVPESEAQSSILVRPDAHQDFHILNNLNSLVNASYVVRHAVFNGLQARCQSSCQPCKLNAAYQLCLCHTIGFSCRPEAEAAERWLHQSGKTSQQWREDIDAARNSKEVAVHNNPELSILWNTGHLLLMNPSRQLKPPSELENECKEYVEEIDNLGAGLSPHHAVVLGIRQSLVMSYVGLGELEKAANLCKDMFDDLVQDARHGPSHAATWIQGSALGAIYYLMGKYPLAAELQRQVVDSMAKINGEDHLFTLSAKSDLSLTYYGQNKMNESKSLLEEATSAIASNLGPTHPTTLVIENDLASIDFQQGDLKSADARFRKVLETKMAILGVDHRSTLATLGNIAVVARRQGDLLEAEKLNRRALAIRKDVLPPDHPDTLTNQGNLAAVLQGLGKLSEAEELARQCFERTKTRLGSDSPETLTSIHNLASIIQDTGRLEDALGLYADCRRRKEHVLGENHQLTLDTVSNMGVVYAAMGKYTQALDCHQGIVNIMLENPEGKNPSTLWDNKLHLGAVHHELGNNAEAKQILFEALNYHRREHEDNMSTFAAMHACASVLESLGDKTGALKLYLGALEGRQEALGPHHPLVLDTVDCLGELYGAMGEYPKAEENCRRAYEGRLKIYEEPHADVYRSASNLSTVILLAASSDPAQKSNTSRLEEARMLAEEALVGCEKLLGMGHPTTKLIKDRMK